MLPNPVAGGGQILGRDGHGLGHEGLLVHVLQQHHEPLSYHLSDIKRRYLGTAGFVSGGLGELTAVPEPGTIAAGLALLGFVAWRERKRSPRWA